MLENNLIGAYLNLHERLGSLQKIKVQSKEALSKVNDHLVQIQTLTNKLNNQQSIWAQGEDVKQLYIYALEQLQSEIVNSAVQFEQHLDKLIIMKQALGKISNIVQSVRIPSTWLQSLTPSQYHLSLYQLHQLAIKLTRQYTQQIELVVDKWSDISSQLMQITINGNQMIMSTSQSIRMLLLHLSFQTMVDGDFLTHWDSLLSTLNNKKYNHK